MAGDILVQIAALMILGIGATWLAAFLRIPSILLLLLAGFLAGPVTGFLNPDAVLGDALLPLVSISVAVILFEGGLQLRFHNIRETSRAVLGLVLGGSIITWGLTTLLARYVLHFGWSLSLLLGAILVVTGPTVIMPLLRTLRPTRRIGAVLRWEGIVNDPLGALLAFVVFEWIQTGEGVQAAGPHLVLFLEALLAGGLAGAIGAYLLLLLLRHYWVPDYLQSAMALMMALAVYTGANLVVPESGLLGVTLTGILLANQNRIGLHHLKAFAEDLRVLLISFLFIALSARIQPGMFTELGIETLVFLALSIAVVRPLAVFLSTARTGLTRSEKALLAWMAPRGIVAAAVASVFALRLDALGMEDANRLLPVVFLVIVGTVAIYGTTVRPWARHLGLAPRRRDGVLFVGAHALVRELATALRRWDIQVVLLTHNEEDYRVAAQEGFQVHYTQIPSRGTLEDLDLSRVGHLVVMTSSDGMNLLAMLQWEEYFGRSRVVHLPLPTDTETLEAGESYTLHGRLLGQPPQTLSHLESMQKNGAGVAVLTWPESTPEGVAPFFIREAHGRVQVITGDGSPPASGREVIALVPATRAEAQ